MYKVQLPIILERGSGSIERKRYSYFYNSKTQGCYLSTNAQIRCHLNSSLFYLHFLGDKSQYRKTLPSGDQLGMVSVRQNVPARTVNVNSHGSPESLSVNYLVGELSLSIPFCSVPNWIALPVACKICLFGE